LIAGVLFSHAFSGELKTVSVVNQAVQDRVTEGGIADDLVPVFDRDLACDDNRCATMAIIENLEEVAPFGRIENRQVPVIEDKELNVSERSDIVVISVDEQKGACATFS
jgi:hypothetical protein